MSQNFNLGLSLIFMQSRNFSLYIFFIFSRFISLKNNYDLNQNFETRFPRQDHYE